MPETATIEADYLATLTPEQRNFLLAYPLHGSISSAAAAIGVHRTSVYNWQAESELFADALLQAKEEAADLLEAELRRRAMTGEGQMPDTLGIFLLKGYRPMFRDSYNVNVQSVSITASLDALADMSPDEQLSLLDIARAAAARRLSRGGAADEPLPLPPG